jgi:hypothetical protein
VPKTLIEGVANYLIVTTIPLLNYLIVNIGYRSLW